MSTLSVGTIKSISSAAPVFQNTSGTEKGQLAKLWCNFNGTGAVAIKDSFNVSSITDEGTGQYSVNFTNAMGDTNYCAGGCIKEKTDNSATSVIFMLGKLTSDADGYTTTKLRVSSAAYVNDSLYDSATINVFIFGDN